MYNDYGHQNAARSMVQGAEVNPGLTSPVIERVETMYNGGTPEFVMDQGLFYPTATNYGYYCTGFESPSEWEDQHRFFVVDGPEVQYAGAQSENLPFVYYTPSYGYAQSPYNPYNPYIPGAIIGVDGSFVGAQQYYSIPMHQDPASSAGYIPNAVQPENTPNGSAEPLLDTGVAVQSYANRLDGRSFNSSFASSSVAFPRNSSKPASNQTNSLTVVSERPRTNVGIGKHSVAHGCVSSGSFPAKASAHVTKSKTASDSFRPVGKFSTGEVQNNSNQLKITVPVNDGFSGFGSNAEGRISVDKLRAKIHVGRSPSDVNGYPNGLDEQNRGPRTSKSKSQLAVTAYTTGVGDAHAQGNVITYTDHYNPDDLSVDYVNARFFVIKSYSEDDVHKSIKYNVWSSTPHGNKKLQCAYEDAQKIAAGSPRGCPIFLFFSVNASGQFCGVAEMVSPVDFNKDMDFWHQNKWSGSFSVKWCLIKDVPNSSLRHIILENNEHKPVTNSRDTQEIKLKQGLEMLKIFKNHNSKTSLLDDFIYYENRQRLMEEEKARLAFRRFQTPFVVPALDPANKFTCVLGLPRKKDEKVMEPNDDNLKKTEVDAAEQPSPCSDFTNSSTRRENSEDTADPPNGTVSTSEMNLPNNNPKKTAPAVSKTLTEATTSVPRAQPADIFTVGSMPVKVEGFAESSPLLTVGTIPLDTRALQLDKGAAVTKPQC